MDRLKKRPYVMFFSQTGSEILSILEQVNIAPTYIVTNRRPEEVRVINSKLLERYGMKLIMLPNRPTLTDYRRLLSKLNNPLITLHGWLRVIPPEICKKYEIYNGHPGLISVYPELKGKDPQVRAFLGCYEIGGCVIHKVSPEVDCGEILIEDKIPIEGLRLEELCEQLHEVSVRLWVKFLNSFTGQI